MIINRVQFECRGEKTTSTYYMDPKEYLKILNNLKNCAIVDDTPRELEITCRIDLGELVKHQKWIKQYAHYPFMDVDGHVFVSKDYCGCQQLFLMVEDEVTYGAAYYDRNVSHICTPTTIEKSFGSIANAVANSFTRTLFKMRFGEKRCVFIPLCDMSYGVDEEIERAEMAIAADKLNKLTNAKFGL